MRERSFSNLRIGQRFASWPTALIGIIIIKAVLALALKPGSSLVSYSGISYLLLLVLATSFAIRNGIENTLGSRPFWVFFAIGCSLWSLHQWIYLYYELGLRIEMPNSSISDTVLFLHIVPFMAALAVFPHRSLADHKPYRAILDFLLLLFFWGFIYGYNVFPYQYSATPGNFGLRFDILYLLENSALVLAAGLLTLRAQAPWKSIYLHLLGASTLYAFSSAVANVAIDSGGYVNGKLYGLGLTASVCWFVWIPLRARQVSGAEARATQSSSSSKASAWAMLMVVAISIPIVWELFHREETTSVRTLRLLVAIATIVCLACAAYISELLAKLELVSRVGLANNRLRLAMESGKSVGWEWDIASGRDFWFGDLKSMFGIPSDTYVGRVEDFHRRVHPQDRERVANAIKDAMNHHQRYAAEFRTLWQDGTVRWVAAKGTFYYARNGDPERMLGMAVDITDRKRTEDSLRESEERLLLAAQAGRMYAYEWDVATDVVVRSPESISTLGLPEPMRLTRQQLLERVHPDDRAKFIAATTGLTPKNPVCHLTYRLLLPSGAIAWREKSARAFFNEEGRMLRTIGMVADVTERKLAEEALSGVSRKVIEAEEHERNRIARDLHEDIGQRLALLAIEIERLKTDPPSQTHEMLNRMDALWKQSLEVLTDVKSSAHELHSPRLEYLGIAAVMRSFCEEFAKRRGVEIDFRSHDLLGLVSPEISLCLFRVLQEALYNAMKHSGVRRFAVQLSRRLDEVNLTVSDCGVGFELEAATKGLGLGLIRMQERVKLLKGTFSIESQPDRGTSIHAQIPLSSGSAFQRAAG